MGKGKGIAIAMYCGFNKRVRRQIAHREELLFISVWALPTASSNGDVAMTRSSSPSLEEPDPCVAEYARNCRNLFADSVLPAPDSPAGEAHTATAELVQPGGGANKWRQSHA